MWQTMMIPGNVQKGGKMKTFIFLLFLFLIIMAMQMGDIFGIILSMMGFLFMWALMDEHEENT